ncbi:Methyl-accepting chemotaxis protein (fragment) [Candidatus Terasakiella magnetica]
MEQAARETGAAAEQISESSTDLSRQAEFLRHEVASFLAQVRSDKKDMVLLRWDNALDTGVPSVDKHHRELFDLVNKFYREMMGGGGDKAAIVMLADLDRTMVEHFKDEESVMAKHGYGQIDAHRRNHADFLDKVHQMRDAVQTGRANAASELFDYVSTWLVQHIRKEDGALARFLAEKRAA